MSEQSNIFRSYERKKGKETRKIPLLMENNNETVVKHSCVGKEGDGSRTSNGTSVYNLFKF